MKYDMNNALQREQFRKRAAWLAVKCSGVVELTECRPVRTMQQNKYMHLIIAVFASEYGETAEYVKQQYFKLAANRELFLVERDDKILGEVKMLRSTSELSTSEMTQAIDRFRDWASMNAGIYLPSPEEHDLLALAEVEVARNARYIRQ